mgnify:CR=1 FL=1
MSELTAEIFACGRWNGMEFTAEDLQGIADTFSKLGDNMRVALKMGHNDAQKMTDGKPALGWVDKVWVVGEKLMAHFTDIPQVVADAIKKKLYKNVSVEMDIDVNHKDTNYPYVLTGVALLGADIPAVNVLKDLTHYMSRGAVFSVGRSVVFSAIAGNQKGDTNMDKIQELTEQVAALTLKLSTMTADTAKMSADKSALEATVARFEADAKTATEAAAKLRIDNKRREVTQILEDGTKAEAITPAQRDTFSKVLRLGDDAAVDALDLEQVKALIPAGKKVFSRIQAKDKDGKDNADLRPDQQVAKEIAELQAGDKELSFTAAQKMVFDRNPELAREYVSLNDKE